MSKEKDGYRNRRAQILAFAIGTAITSTLLLTSAEAVSDGECVSFQVAAPIRLPDGSLHQPGRLTLCHSIPFSPVSSLHRTYVNGMPIGMLRSRKTTNEAGGDLPPVVLFHRDDEGYLELFGYVLPARHSSVTYLFGEENTKISPKNRIVASRPQQSGPVVAVAALAE